MSLVGFSLIGKYTLPSLSGVHTDFVAYLKYNDFSNSILDLLDDGGGDLRFSSDEAGNSQLPCEVVEFDKAGSAIQIWVKIPTATTGTVIYIWGDNTGATQPISTDPYGRSAVWSDYWAAYHFTDLTDSSGNSNDLTVVGTPTLLTQEIIGNAYDFADSGDYLYTDSVFVSENESFLMSFYYKVEDINDLPLGGYVYSIADSTDAFDNYAIVLNRAGTELYIELFDRTTSSSSDRIFAFTPSNDDIFKIIAQVSSTGTDLTVIHNGVVHNDNTSTRRLRGSGFNRLSVNRIMDSSPAEGSGILADEPRLGKHNVIRSQSFLEDEYDNQTSITSWGVIESIVQVDDSDFYTTFNVTPSSTFEYIENQNVGGASSLNFTSDSDMNYQEVNTFSGSSSVTIISATDFKFNENYYLNGYSEFLTGSSSELEYSENYFIDGNSGINVNAESVITQDNEFTFLGNNTISFVNNSSINSQEFYTLNGNTTLSVSSESQISTFDEYLLEGSITLNLTNDDTTVSYKEEYRFTPQQSIDLVSNSNISYIENYNIIGDNVVSIISNSTIIEDYVINGSCVLNINNANTYTNFKKFSDVLLYRGANISAKYSITTINALVNKIIIGVK